MNKLHGSLNRSEVEALRERDEACRKLSHAIASMEAARRILADRDLSFAERAYEARAYLLSRIEVARGG